MRNYCRPCRDQSLNTANRKTPACFPSDTRRTYMPSGKSDKSSILVGVSIRNDRSRLPFKSCRSNRSSRARPLPTRTSKRPRLGLGLLRKDNGRVYYYNAFSKKADFLQIISIYAVSFSFTLKYGKPGGSGARIPAKIGAGSPGPQIHKVKVELAEHYNKPND